MNSRLNQVIDVLEEKSEGDSTLDVIRILIQSIGSSHAVRVVYRPVDDRVCVEISFGRSSGEALAFRGDERLPCWADREVHIDLRLGFSFQRTGYQSAEAFADALLEWLRGRHLVALMKCS